MNGTYTTADVYSQVLTNFLAQEFPGSTTNAVALFEALSAEFFGTKQHRYGPMPNVEHQSAIREILHYYVDQGLPIPVLVPWGSSKQGDHGLDVLELSALRNIDCLNKRVKQHYTPGISVTMRIEDATDMMLFDASYLNKITDYALNMKRLVQGLGYNEIDVQRETDLMRFSEFRSKARYFGGIIATHLKNPTKNSLEDVKAIGWQGTFPAEQIDYYLRSYRIFYPHLSDTEIFGLIGTYFGCSLARRVLNGTGAPNAPHVQLAFSLPVPGIPWQLGKNRLYYRTVPERWTNNHKAPWIGRGYVQVANDNTCKIKLVNFNDKLDFTPFEFRIGDAVIEAPFVLV